MSDLISRQAAIDAIARTARKKFNLSDEFNHYLAGLMDGENAIRQLPPAQPEPRWIPCSERLPEDNGNYLVTYIYKDDEKGTEEPYMISDMFLPWKGAFATEEPTDKAQAWMPLPEPYEGSMTNGQKD